MFLLLRLMFTTFGMNVEDNEISDLLDVCVCVLSSEGSMVAV